VKLAGRNVEELKRQSGSSSGKRCQNCIVTNYLALSVNERAVLYVQPEIHLEVYCDREQEPVMKSAEILTLTFILLAL